MDLKSIFNRENLLELIPIIIGTGIGLLSVYICLYYNLSVKGFNIHLIVAPLIAGLVETYVAQKMINKSSGAISSIILFVVTNYIGWFHPANPIQFNIFTVGGIILMLQAAFPLTINYILIALAFVVIYVFGKIATAISNRIRGKNPKIRLDDIEFDDSNDNIMILTNQPEIPIKEYLGLIFAEYVVDFDKKDKEERFEYMGSKISTKNDIKRHDYVMARKYILQQLKAKADKMGANAIIDIEIEYTNYNQQIPPDMLMSVYGTAVNIDESYLN